MEPMKPKDADAAATEDMEMVWAYAQARGCESKSDGTEKLTVGSANGNSILASFWILAKVLQRPRLLAKARKWVESYRLDRRSGQSDFDRTKLCS